MWTERWFLKLQGRYRLAMVYLRDHADELGIVSADVLAGLRMAVGIDVSLDELVANSHGRLQRVGVAVVFVEQNQRAVEKLTSLGVVKEESQGVEDRRLQRTLDQFRLLNVPEVASDWQLYYQRMELVVRELYQRSNGGVSAITVEQWIIKVTSEHWTLAELQRAIESILGNPAKKTFTKCWEDLQAKSASSELDDSERLKLERLPSLIAEAPNDRIRQRYEQQYAELKARA